jgi:hypothetical protein
MSIGWDPAVGTPGNCMIGLTTYRPPRLARRALQPLPFSRQSVLLPTSAISLLMEEYGQIRLSFRPLRRRLGLSASNQIESACCP